jgi:limonene 1,2-monooxygenase
MTRMRFGAFLAPHHPIGEHPTLQYRSDLALAAHLDRLGYDEFWCGEHHSTGWEMIASPEMFLAAAGRAHHTHHAGHRRGVAALSPSVQRRAAHGAARPHDRRARHLRVGPGALPSDAYTWASTR